MNFGRTSYSSKVTFMPLIQYLITEPSVVIILVSINTGHFLVFKVMLNKPSRLGHFCENFENIREINS